MHRFHIIHFLWALMLSFGCSPSTRPAGETRDAPAPPAPFTPNGEIRITRDHQEIGTLPAEYIPLDYPDMPWRGDPGIGMTGDGRIYVSLYARVFLSRDAGKTWESRSIDVDSLDPPMRAKNYDSFGVLRDGTLLWAYRADDPPTDFLLRSTDGGESWHSWSRLDNLSPFMRAGGNQNCLLELRDGTLLWPTIMAAQHAYDREDASKPPPTTYVFRSTDGGKSWEEKHSLQQWGTETNLLELHDGRLLAAIRYQRRYEAPPPQNEPPSLIEDHARREIQKSTVGKRVFLSDSADGGRSWQNFRPVWRQTDGPMDLEFGQAHGHMVQLSDGTVVLVVEDRYPYPEGDVRARISRDGGQTWLPEVYHLSPGHGYGASVVLEDDTIVTALGNTPLDERGRPVGSYTAQVVRWRLPN
ncbi:MAG: sialidase family protein [Acidobacteriota bacterium]|nr:sialidase family protein [Acidobacteriota bacterium]